MKTILVAEDEFDLLSMIQSILEDEGYRVQSSTNGREALAALKASKPDLFITDVMMPHMSGLEVISQVNEDPKLKDLPRILMSAVRTDIDDAALKHGTFLRKPFSIEQLIAAVSKLMKK